jgi:hypothetical protein
MPQRVGPTPKPGESRRVDGKGAFREASSIKEETGNIRCEGWKYRSLYRVEVNCGGDEVAKNGDARMKAMVS